MIYKLNSKYDSIYGRLKPGEPIAGYLRNSKKLSWERSIDVPPVFGYYVEKDGEPFIQTDDCFYIPPEERKYLLGGTEGEPVAFRKKYNNFVYVPTDLIMYDPETNYRMTHLA